MSRYKKLAEFLERQRVEISRREGHIVTWQELANRVGVAFQSMGRYKDGNTMPELAVRQRMAEVFGPDIWVAMGMLPPDLDPAFLRLYLGAKQDPNLKRILDDAMERAQEYQEKQPTTGQLSFV
ncbi:MAG: hypothetical protein UY48_C0001G0003 [Candidatus Gottesmanbacteria bacterium GW2011_GWB1_49_7]|uniref:HTH cro/C1-type domain-containing protein n=1 Tax=Candidatus Gottesmanbacteria bacterium GW2011_GWB1_49_7 TaxID=1618448 RepID=A0A0G1YEH4_9BACT|nr:MAG: hypothetical protein UY48_C0001G0003 [Candidatus Gottesmanbacteria bacterium GW2011_GWB1_49_7]